MKIFSIYEVHEDITITYQVLMVTQLTGSYNDRINVVDILSYG